MKKIFYYTLDLELIRVYSIENNIPTEICRFFTNNKSDLNLKVILYLIERNYSDGNIKVEKL